MTAPSKQAAGRWRALSLLAVALVLPMTTWFSASAVVPQLQTEWGLSEDAAAWLTIAVQLGFVCGALVSSILNLPDVVSPRHVILGGSTGAAGVNGLLLVAGGAAAGLLLRTECFTYSRDRALPHPHHRPARALLPRHERAGGSRTLPPEAPLDMEKVGATAEKYKVEVLGPPPGAPA